MSFAAQDLAAIGIPCQKFSPLNIRTKLLQYNPFAQMLDGKLRKGQVLLRLLVPFLISTLSGRFVMVECVSSSST